MASLNKVQLIGRLGKDPETRNFDNGSQVANFSVATDESYKNKKGEKVESTEWHNIVIWGKLAEVAVKYLNKGDQVYLEGKLKTRSWEKDGVTKYITEIWVDNMVMLGGKKEGNSSPSNASKSSTTSKSSGSTKSLGNAKESAPSPNIDVLPWDQD